MANVVFRRLAALAVAGSALVLRPAFAQPVIDQGLEDAQLAVQKGCAILRVNFRFRMSYASHFPVDHGDEVWIRVSPLDRNLAAALLTLRREAATVPDGKLHGIKTITLETRDAIGPVLRILFDHPVYYQVAATAVEPWSVVIAIAGAKPSPTCRPIYPGPAYTPAPAYTPLPAAAPSRGGGRPGVVSESELRAIAGWMDEGRAVLRRNEPGAAIQTFTKILKYPEHQYTAEALELLGLAHQKNGQIAEAKAEYEDYLRRYANNAGSERVRQRLAGLVTANDDASAALRMPVKMPAGAPPIGRFAPADETVWTLVGSASSFYIRDDSFSTVRDPTLALNPNASPDAYQVHQNEMLSTLDLTATWNNNETKGKIRFSGSEEYALSDSKNLAGVGAFSVDTLVKSLNLRTVAGRQTLNTDGVLGRFDGVLFSWQALPMVRVDLVGGTPAASRFDLPFKDEKYFYSAGIGLGSFMGTEATLYAIEQKDRQIVDRQAVGADVRYNDVNKFAFVNVDYDVHFQQLNAAIFSGSWILPDKSTIYGGADYRRTPYMSTWNALLNLNQPFATLYDALKAQNSADASCLMDLVRCVVNQTPIYKSAMLGFSHPLTEKLQISADATIVNLSQPYTPLQTTSAAGTTTPVTFASGNEYYASTSLFANNIFKEGDMYIGALRYSQTGTSNQYMVDLTTRFPVTNEWRVSPRLRLGYTTGTGVDLKEYTVLPSFLVDYYWTKDLNLEFEVGAQYTNSMQAGIRSQDTELLATVGFRYDFYSDTTKADEKNKAPNPVATALCRYSTTPNCASPYASAGSR
jgi:hypothetical protein